MSKKTVTALIVAVAAVVAIVLYAIQAGKEEPFRPPMAAPEADGGLTRLLERDAELRALQSWVELSPEDAMAHAAYGSALIERGLFAHAKEHLTEAVALDPRNGEAHRDLGTALSKLDEGAAAMEHWRRAVELNPNDPAAHNNLGNGYFDSEQPLKAIAAWRKSLDLDPYFAPTRVNLGYALLAVDSMDAAHDQLKIALSLDPDLASAHYATATLWGYKGDVDSTIHYLGKGLDLSPETFKSVISHPAFNSAKDDKRLGDLLRKHAGIMRRRAGRSPD